MLLLAAWLVIASVLYAVVDVFLFGYIARIFPANLPYYFDFGARTFFQYSKRGDIPENYIAIFGDSYAEGQGDWFLTNQYKRMPDTQATHLLYKSTGRDVVTFGVAGAGSSAAYLEYPSVALGYIRSLWFYDIKDPDIIFLYFYEGNDIQDNDFDYQKTYLPKGYDPQRLDDIQYFSDYVKKEYLEPNEAYRGIYQNGISNNFLMARFAKYVVTAVVAGISNGTFGHQEAILPASLLESAEVSINGKVVLVPRLLQAPPIDRTEEERRIALKFFENSIKLVALSYPHSKIGVVYVPAPASGYTFISEMIDIDTGKPQSAYPTALLNPASNLLCQDVLSVVMNAGMFFHDTRLALRQAAATEFIHGPNDWNHFSETGYRVLAKELFSFYQRIEQEAGSQHEHGSSSCATLQ